MKSIENDIANGNIKNIYLLMGVEPYLINQFRDKLVDDIYTTGSTVNAVAELLLQAGVREVYFIAIAVGRGF